MPHRSVLMLRLALAWRATTLLALGLTAPLALFSQGCAARPGSISASPARTAAGTPSSAPADPRLVPSNDPPSPPRTSFLFSSGLNLVVDPEARGTGLVGVVTLVEAGAGDEPPALSGLAHLAEHLVFESTGPDHLRLARKVQRMGGIAINASTSADLTEFHALVPRSQALALLAAEVEALSRGTSGVTAEAFERERRVVLAERARRGVGAELLGVLAEALFPVGHPMRNRVGGDPKSLNQAKLADVQQFIGRHYRPARITIYVTGDLGTIAPETFARTIPPSWRGHKDAAQKMERHVVASETPPDPATGPRLATLRADVAAPRLVLAWAIPADAFPSLFVQRSVTSRMARALKDRYVQQEKAAFGVRDAEVYAITQRRGALLVADVSLAPGASAERVAEDIARTVSTLPVAMSRGGVDARGQWATAIHLAAEGDDLARRLIVQGRWAHQGTAPARDETPTIEARDRALAALESSVTVERMRGVLVRPLRGEGEHDVEADLVPVTGEVPHLPDGDDEPELVPASREQLLAAISPIPPERLHERTLDNGLTLLSLEMPAARLGAALVGFRSPLASAADKTTAAAWEASAEEALIHRHGDVFIHEERFLAGRHDALLEHWNFAQRSEVRRWPPTRSDALVSGREEESRPVAALHRQFVSALWEGDVRGFVPTTADVERASWSALTSWARELTRPQNGALVVVGDVRQAAVEEAAERTLGTWKALEGAGTSMTSAATSGATPAFGPPHPLTIVDGRQDTPGESVAWWGCRLPNVKTPQDEAIAAPTTTLLAGVLHRHLREELGQTYAVSARLSIEANGAAIATGTFDVHGPPGPARATFAALFDEKRPLNPDPLALDRARWQEIGEWNERAAHPVALAHRLFDQWRRQMPRDPNAAVRAVVDVSMSQIEAAWSTCATHGTLAVAEGRAM